MSGDHSDFERWLRRSSVARLSNAPEVREASRYFAAEVEEKRQPEIEEPEMHAAYGTSVWTG